LAPDRAARPGHAAPAARPGGSHPGLAAGHLAGPVGGGVRGGAGGRLWGPGGIALFEQVYDTERDPAPRPMPPVPIPRDVTGTDLVRASLRRLPETTVAGGGPALG